MEGIKFVSASNRAHTAITFLYVMAGLDTVLAATSVARLLSQGTSEPSLFGIVLGCLYAVAAMTCGVFFLQWMYRAYANLPALGATRLKFSPGWAVGSFFVPFAHLIHPLYAMREIWHHSSRTEPLPRIGAWGWPVPLIGGWWATYLVSNFLGNYSFQMSLKHRDAQMLATAEWIGAVGSIVAVPAAFLAIAVIRKIDAMQTAATSASPSVK